VGARDDRSGGPTIFEVAEAAGVSITTVSHVFSGKRPVGEGTRKRVEAAAADLGYSPRRTAQALASGRTMTLAIQFPYPGSELLFNPYFSEMIPAMSEAAVGRGYAFVLVPPDPPRDAFLRPLIERRGIDAAILLDPILGDVFPPALADAGVPFVSLGRVPGMPGTPRVDQDFPAAMETVVAHLRAEGYERPALLTLPGQLTTLLDIQAAFGQAAPEGAVVITADTSDVAADDAANRLLAGARRPDAVVCLSERQAAAVYRAAAQLGLRIPQDLGVAALGDSLAAGMRPPLTSVTLFPADAGRALIELADRVLAGEEVPTLTLVEFELRARRSTSRGSDTEAPAAG
jgi:DNA-binding LacI/PurR family transcriptional regulator